jgi:hypothetical protein
LISESGSAFPSDGTMVRCASKFENIDFTKSSIPLKALSTTIMAAVMNATTTIEIPDMKLIMPFDFLANKCRRAM